MSERKIRELRPSPCSTRVGDIVEREGEHFLKIKCRRCTKEEGQEVFHYVRVPADSGFSVLTRQTK